MLTLVSHHLCPYVQRAAIAFAEKGVAFERLSIDLDAKPEWFKAISPLGKVPLLKIGSASGEEAVLFESAAICEYIEETQAGPPLHPGDPIGRARHRAWIEFASSVLSDIYVIETTADATLFARRKEMLTEKFTRLERTLGAGPYFGGDRFSLVDAAFGPVFRYFDVLDVITDFGILAHKPKVEAWRTALATRPSVRSAVGADYNARLWRFLEARDSHLRGIMWAGGGSLLGRPHHAGALV